MGKSQKLSLEEALADAFKQYKAALALQNENAPKPVLGFGFQVVAIGGGDDGLWVKITDAVNIGDAMPDLDIGRCIPRLPLPNRIP